MTMTVDNQLFLKRLDVIGFKSFAERISVEFVSGVTAVVGPNGSGKSNITDSIRWVLGEQSAKSLRGAKMEDIIFAGSDSRKPLNFAEVTLTLNNESKFLPIDFHEVSVTRRVTRSGDSDFYINNQPCRLKDIIDLFMDSGLGKEAFSIISQGKVEEILSSKPEERRTIFEEAAGVLKYKTRKKKAEAKLEETRANLNRVQDILHELEGQVEPLKIQASIARDYLQKKEELEEFEAALLVYEVEDLHRKWTSLKEQLEGHQANEADFNARISAKETEVEKNREKLVVLDSKLQELQSALLSVSEELEKVEGRKQVLKERMKNASQNKNQLEKTLAASREKISILSASKDEKSEALSRLKQETEALKRELSQKQGILKNFAGDLEAKIEALKSDYIEYLNRQATVKHELAYLKQQLEQQTNKHEKLDHDNEKLLKARESVTARLSEAEARLKAVQQDLTNQVHRYRETERTHENLKNQYEKQEKTLYQAYQYLQKAKSRKEMLEEMEDEYSGFFQGVKEILKAKDKELPGVHGAVAELIQVPKDYALAIETALGGALQNIVMDKESDARTAIAFLKKNRLGRATFLPLSIIKGKYIPAQTIQSISSHPAFIGVGAELIQYDSRYKEIMMSLLGNVLIVRDLVGANEIAKMAGYRYRLVTLEGDVVSPGGAMTGGASRQSGSSILSRKGEIEELTEKLGQMEEQTSKLEAHVKALKNDVASSEKQLVRLREAGETLRVNEEAIKGQIREWQNEQRNVNERLTIYDMEKSTLDEEQTYRESRIQELNQELSRLEHSIIEVDREINLYTEQKKTDQSNKEELNEEVNELKIRLASKSEQLQHQQNEVERLGAEIAALELTVKDAEEDLALLNGEMTSSSTGENNLVEMAAEKQKLKDETVHKIAALQASRQELSAKIEEADHILKEWNRQYKGLSENLRDEEIKLNRLDVEMDTRLDMLREEYMLTFEAAKEKYPLTIEAEEAKRKVRLIRLAIEELGTVNIGAIDEYERVSERYEFLVTQRDDLKEAKDTLFDVIDEMDEEMKRRFEITFNAIKKEFNFVFPSLFGGGRAELKLTDPGDILNTGVDIIAQPPGKKLQNLSLLSGGERALTAIALLFAILRVRPVPFCILDEVEAALDEANVYRFSQYLKKFSKETQFIVITHRKGTMEEADVLYGVTMQESGVSRLVSVKLEETKELVESK